MKFNPTAFIGIDNRRYRNWDGYSLAYSYDFIKAIEPFVDLYDINTVFDIGSRDSCQAMELSDWFPEANIYLFEPVPSSFEYCVDYTKERSNIHCSDIALSNYSGETTFYQVVNGNVGASSLLKINDQFSTQMHQSEIKVKVDRADRFMIDNNIESVDLLWVDVQGSEIDCFSGFGDGLSNVKAIHTEVGINSFYEELLTFMDNAGFANTKVIQNEVGLEVDVVFVNKKYIK